MAVDTVSGIINGGVAGTGVRMPALMAPGGVTGAVGYEVKKAWNGETKNMSTVDHVAGCLYNGTIGALGNLGGAVLYRTRR